jgi:ubiquinone/menaquinone biosynthesis C-methylase UbiE
MNADLQRRIQRYGWDRAVQHYEPYWREQLEPAQRLMLDLSDLTPGERVLDIASGTGLVTFPAAERVGPKGHVLATDISERMVESVLGLAAEKRLGHVAAERMDAEDLRLPERHFDAALCGLGLMYVPDPLQAVREMRRVVKPGGRALAAVWGRRDRCGWAEIFPIVDARVKTEVCPLFFQLGTGDVLKETFRIAGFTELVSERIATTLTYASADAALGAAFAGGPVALAYSRFDEKTREEAHSEYLASIEPYRNGRGYAIPGEFVVAGGRRPVVDREAVASSRQVYRIMARAC